MIVPTKDYSPLMRSNAARNQAEQSRFIAPNIDYQRKSLELQRKGIKQKIGAVNSQQTFNTMSFMLGLGQAAVKTASVVQDYQTQKADTQVRKDVSDMNTAILKGVADGSITMTDSGVSGLSTLDSLKESQLAAIDSQKWFRSVKNDAKEALNNAYAERENAINQAIYRDTIQKRSQIDEINLDSYIKNDASRISDITPENAYKLGDEYIDSRTYWSDTDKQLAKLKSHAETDWLRAENSVADASRRSRQEGLEEVDRLVVANKYDNTQRDHLTSIVNGTGKQMAADLTSEGLNTMAQGLQEDIDPKNIRDAADEKIKDLGEEYKTAYKNGMETAQLTYCSNIVADLTAGIDDATTTTDIQNIKSSLEARQNKFKGGKLSEALYESTMDKLDKMEALQTTEDFDQQYQAIASTLLPKLANNEMTPKQALTQLDIMMKGADANKVAVIEKLTSEVIGRVDKASVPAIKRTREVIKQSYMGRFGNDFLTAQGPIYDDIRQAYMNNLVDADMAIMDLCLNKGNLSEAQIEVEAQRIRDGFRNRNALIFADIEDRWNIAYPEKGRYGDEIKTFEATNIKDVKALETEKENALKKDKAADVTALNDKIDVLRAVGKSSNDSLRNWIPRLEKTNPAFVGEYIRQMRQNYNEIAENPEKLETFRNLKRSSDPPKIIKDRSTGNTYIDKDEQYGAMKDLEGLYASVEGTDQGKDFFGNITKDEKQMLNEFFGQSGIPVEPGEWEMAYIPGAGFTYTKKGEYVMYRIARGNSRGEYKVQGNYGNTWIDITPDVQQYNIYTPEGFTEYITENRQGFMSSIRGEDPKKNNLKFNRLEDMVANAFKKEE